MVESNRILSIIVVAQFCCTSLWFAGNGVMNDLITDFNLSSDALGHLTSVVQFGFISGTLLFAILTIADRYSPSKVFMVCALFGALFNLGLMLPNNTLTTLLIQRFITGFFLAGIYPVGMKIAADYFKEGLGKSLGYLVGALVVGTALPHILKGFSIGLPWSTVIIITSGLATIGGFMLFWLVPNGPYRQASCKLDFTALIKVFRHQQFRSAAFGYFGHMWELYAFWAFVPVMLASYDQSGSMPSELSTLSFVIIGIGGLGCILSGYLSMRWGAKRIAFAALFCSCICCLVSPWILMNDSSLLLILFLCFWGIVVVADSPLFSTLVANNAPAESKGTALTVVNCVGFSITILSIQLINSLQQLLSTYYLYMFLAIGPILGLLALSYKPETKRVSNPQD